MDKIIIIYHAAIYLYNEIEKEQYFVDKQKAEAWLAPALEDVTNKIRQWTSSKGEQDLYINDLQTRILPIEVIE